MIVGKEGCSTYFLLGKIAVDDPGAGWPGVEMTSYNENGLFNDGLVAKLFEGRFYQSERFDIWFAKLGTKPRTEALNAAIEKATEAFKSLYGFSDGRRIVKSGPRLQRKPCALQVTPTDHTA